MIGDAGLGWRLLWFVALRRLPPVGTVLLTTGLVASLALPFRLAPARTFTMTVAVRGLEDAGPLPIAAIEVTAGHCLLAEAAPSPAGSAPFVLPTGNYTVTARTNADGQVAGWAMEVVSIHLDRDLDVAIDHQLAPESDLYSMRAAPPPSCPAR
jgi:hypothetical protein